VNCSVETARSLFLSDLHLGWRHSRARCFIDRLFNLDLESLYLVGDTFEWIRRDRDSSCEETDRFLQAVESLRSKGTKVIILPGNHDEQLAVSENRLAWQSVPMAIHKTVRGERYLISHGDIFDLQRLASESGWEVLGRFLYPRLVRLGNRLHRWGIEPNGGSVHWCAYWKLLSRRAQRHVVEYQQYMVALARSYECCGVVCGHIHLPLQEGRYHNCGDWIEHNSFLYECSHGELLLDCWESLTPMKCKATAPVEVALLE